MTDSHQPNDIVSRRVRFSIGRSLLWVTFTCGFVALFANLPATGLGVAAATATALLFATYDVCTSRQVVGISDVAYFAAALSNCVVAALMVFVAFPPSTPSLPPMAPLQGVLWFVTGGLAFYLSEHIGQAIAAVFAYILTASALSALSLLLALMSLSSRASKIWFVLLNLPGILAMCWLCWVFTFEVWNR